MDNRKYGIDIIKIIAAFFVVILHVNGYTLDLHEEFAGYSQISKLIYYILEAIAYPAIHLFVLAGATLLIERGSSISNISNIWMQTIILCFTGFLIAVIIKFPINLGGGIAKLSTADF